MVECSAAEWSGVGAKRGQLQESGQLRQSSSRAPAAAQSE